MKTKLFFALLIAMLTLSTSCGGRKNVGGGKQNRGCNCKF